MPKRANMFNPLMQTTMNRIRNLLLAAAGVVCLATSAQKTITNKVYWIDADYTSVRPTTTAIDISGLAPGVHSYHMRVQDSEGMWSAVTTKFFIIPHPAPEAGATAITAREYWLDGKLATRAPLANSPAVIDIGALSSGLHMFSMRVRDDKGRWSNVQSKYFIVPVKPDEQPDSVTITRCRYWFDGDMDHATMAPLTAANGILEIDLGDLATGEHTLSWMVGDSKGAWSKIMTQSFEYVQPLVTEIISVNDITIKMVKVEGGQLNGNNIPEFYIGQYEVTEKLWNSVMGSNPSTHPGNLADRKPVESVSWTDCRQFIELLKEKTGVQFRLPTEAEWEFAARGGVRSHGYTYSGSNNIDDVAWYAGNCSGKQPVGTKAPNELDLYDMTGNVYEFVQDSTMLCGGGWHAPASRCEVTYRWTDGVDENYTDDDTGLRLATSSIVILQGDVNGDGKVNVLDVTALINVILNIVPADTYGSRCYINDDNKINVLDVTMLINIILGVTS